jgi:hypothetical protein
MGDFKRAYESSVAFLAILFIVFVFHSVAMLLKTKF